MTLWALIRETCPSCRLGLFFRGRWLLLFPRKKNRLLLTDLGPSRVFRILAGEKVGTRDFLCWCRIVWVKIRGLSEGGVLSKSGAV